MASRPAAGGGVWVEVGPDRFAGWCERFAQRHGGSLAEAPRLIADDGETGETGETGEPGEHGGQAVRLTAADGSVADCRVPFPPLAATAGGSLIEDLAAHALAPRVAGVLLVRRGGYAVGVFDGSRLVDSKVGARHVQGRTKAGGWSQQRFARRREGQAREAYAAAADTAARILLPHAARLDVLIVGGDTGALSALRADVRLATLWPKEAAPFLNVGDPKMADLQKAPDGFRAIRIRLVERS